MYTIYIYIYIYIYPILIEITVFVEKSFYTSQVNAATVYR